MKLDNLFKTQKELDEYIETEHPRSENEERLLKKILALQVELGELANEWQGFKFWKKNRKPMTNVEVFCEECQGTGTPVGIPEYSGVDCLRCCGLGSYYKNPLLEEYVDCLHFYLSIGNEMKIRPDLSFEMKIRHDLSFDKSHVKKIMTLFALVNIYTAELWWEALDNTNESISKYVFGFQYFLELGETLGFTWEEIEAAYFAKNQINHERQKNSY